MSSIDALILNEQDTTLEFVKQVYSLLTEKRLLPPVKLYENQQQSGQINNQAKKETAGISLDEDPKLKRETDQSMKLKGQSSNQSPQKNIAIKGPPKIINESLEIENYQGVKVTDIAVKQVNLSVS